MKLATKTKSAINAVHRDEEDPRTYLGGSVLGKACARELWYAFRWAAFPKFSSRVKRLFGRGNREEAVFEELLNKAGIPYFPVDPATGEQFVVRFKNKHLGGHSDGVGHDLPDLEPGVAFLTEWKTHSEKSFREVVKKGVEQAKPVHYTQMQIYMNKIGLQWALYGAVNKNNDDLYFELVAADPAHAEAAERKGDAIVWSEKPPERLSNNPGWYECKFCDFHRVCHKGAPMEVTCRSCVNAKPLVTGEWWCGFHDRIVDKEEQLAGCQDHAFIR